ncbi:aldehyde dehydrogenase family protein [Haloarcula japonica]|uniref:aldehyde dehydrogenase family protein n=1 Tax=Haloarcula japonica TaxID=29282 RepID=UPI0039F6653E
MVLPLFPTTADRCFETTDDVSKISFTGSTEVGKEIIRSFTADIEKTILELGGKSPIIVYPDANFEEAVEAASQ